MKQKSCRACKETFTPTQFAQVVCDWKCSLEYEKIKKSKKEAKAHTKAKQEFKLNDKRTQRNLAQKYFNRFIRLRDTGQPCISCGRNHKGQIHAGHFKSTGSAPQLRFNEDNCHAQCAPCNNHLSGNIGPYRENLLAKIGKDRLAFLEGPHEPVKYSAEDYVTIKKKYLEKCQELELAITIDC